ncbi:MAG: DUF4350 domain-containing protein, partial [Novosphingobium sp.]|nr:DUF4350 domain-containing protein [Novosphingobium sp.]
RSEAVFDQHGLLVLTPPHLAEARTIDGIITRRRHIGPTLLVLPKWQAMPVPAAMQSAKIGEGWVILGDAMPPLWGEHVQSLGKLDLKVEKPVSALPIWRGLGSSGHLPDARAVQTLFCPHVTGLVLDERGRVLAGYLADGASYSGLEDASGQKRSDEAEEATYPLVIVAEPDLFNNYGFSRKENALLALALVEAMMSGEHMPVHFDLTLNGLGRSANLLTLAFTPPFLAATLCLLMAALAVGWRGFSRFGPPRKEGRAIAFGKRALVANTAGLLLRAGRYHLIASPYVERARSRLARALALSHHASPDATDQAIDRALAVHSPTLPSFSELARRLHAARNQHDIIRVAQQIHALERILTR